MKKRFNIRVELLGGADGNDYAHLHERMGSNHFAPFIVADNKTVHHLPPAEYVHVSEGTALQVRDHANAIIASVLRAGLSYRTYVVEFVDWASTNLLPAK
ncbi:hypothetical protein [Paraburkholderia caledonica]|uniref:hypothetical protein n=1 Tax=Paraburkholderia caledonica TaxID=134536 RepID=UPI0038BB783E